MNRKIQVSVRNFENLEEITETTDIDSWSLPVKIQGIVDAYKGPTKMSNEKVQRMSTNFENRKHIRIREQERVLFSTGITIDMPEGVRGNIYTAPAISMFKGLQVVGTELHFSEEGELLVMLHNSSLHLSDSLAKGEIVAFITFSPILNLDFQIHES